MTLRFSKEEDLIETKIEISEAIQFIEEMLVHDESLDFQCIDIEKYLIEKDIIFEKIKSYVDVHMFGRVLSSNGKRQRQFDCVKLKLTHGEQSAFFDIKQEVCNFLKNQEIIFTSYERPVIYDYIVIDKKDLKLSTEELLRKRVEMYCSEPSSVDDFVNMIVTYRIRDDFENMAFDVKLKTNNDFEFEYEEGYEYTKFPKSHLRNYFFEIMINNETFKVKLNQMKTDDEESFFYHKPTLDYIEKQNYLLD